MSDQPLVSVLTPVYNGADFLAECIESVLKQTYTNFEYIVVNNCSQDRTLEIAQEYAKKDSRIRVHDNTDFVPVIANHNIAFSLMSPLAKYCKVVSGDDFLFPECLMRMVECAEANPSVGIIGSYQLSGDHIRWQGFQYPKAVLPGRELCRRIFLGSDSSFGFGSPTSIMYRADLVRSVREFYPNPSPHSDTSACFRDLQNSDFGFVYQVLCYERTHEATQTSKSTEMNRYSSACLNDVIHYGPLYLNQEELKRVVKESLKDYHRFLAVNYFIGFKDKAFWDYHKSRLQELGHPLTRFALYKAAITKVGQEAINPGLAVRKMRGRFFRQSASSPKTLPARDARVTGRSAA